MHKKLVVVCLPVFLLIFFSSLANAQLDTSTDSASRLKQQRAEIKQQIKDTVQKKREETRAMIKIKRDEFKARLQTIRDAKKKALVDRIDIKLTNVNAKHTDRFTQVLENLQTVLDKMSEDIDKTEAQAAIGEAKLAVENQAAKTYTITISTETALRSDVGAVTSQLRLDLMATHKLVIDAKQEVQALRTNNAIMKTEATSSANL